MEEKKAEDDPCNVVVGPVIGKVTSNSAQIMVEVDKAAEVTCVLERAGEKHERKMQFPVNRPRVFFFDGLSKETLYEVSLLGVGNADGHTGEVFTYSDDPAKFRVIVTSCDKGPPKRGKVNMWEALYDRFVAIPEERVNLMLRIGDQCYCDEAYDNARKTMREKQLSREEKMKRITEDYRRLYRWTFSQPDVHDVISRVPQLMMWDDHEVRNDWGTQKQDTNPAHRDWTIGLCARQAYWEYQRQMWDNIDSFAVPYVCVVCCDLAQAEEPDGEGHMHLFGHLGIVLVDSRGSRSFYANEEDKKANSVIGAVQWQKLERALSPEGLFKDARCLIMLQSQPFAYVSTCASSCLGCFPAMKDKVLWGLHPDEQERYLRLVRRWKEESELKRDVLLVGGDLHYAIKTRIMDKEGNTVLRHIITSAISNQPPPRIAYWIYWCLSCFCCSRLGTTHSMRVEQDWFTRNFAVIDADPSNSKIQERIVTTYDVKREAKEMRASERA